MLPLPRASLPADPDVDQLSITSVEFSTSRRLLFLFLSIQHQLAIGYYITTPDFCYHSVTPHVDKHKQSYLELEPTMFRQWQILHMQRSRL